MKIVLNYFNRPLKLIALTEEEWLIQKKQYVQNLKNKKVYSFITEDDIQYKENESDELANIASEIVSEEKIEFN